MEKGVASLASALVAFVKNPDDFSLAQQVVQLVLAEPANAEAAIPLAMMDPHVRGLRRRVATGAPSSQGFVYRNLKMPEPPYRFPAPPKSVAELEAMVTAALAGKQKGKGLGGAWAFSNVAFTDGWLIRLDGLDSILPIEGNVVPPSNETLLHFEAGATIDKLNGAMPAGYGLINQPGYELLTFAGVASAGGHGSGLRYASLADAIRSMRFLCVDASGSIAWRQIEPTKGISDPTEFASSNPGVALIQDDDTFDACIVSMGSMGILHSMIIALREVTTISETREYMTWDEAKIRYATLLAETRKGDTNLHSFVIWLNPYPRGGAQHAVLSTYREVGGDPQGQRPPVITSTGGSRALEKVVVWIVNLVPAAAPALIDAAIVAAVDTDVRMPPPMALNFGAPNGLDVTASACGVALQDAITAADRLSEVLQQRKAKTSRVLTSTFGLRFVPASRGLVSPQYARDTCMIEVPCLAGTRDADATVNACWSTMVSEFGGRPHWGQVNPLDGATAATLYPRFEDFRRVYLDMNPTGVFDNAFTEQLALRPKRAATKKRAAAKKRAPAKTRVAAKKRVAEKTKRAK